MIRGHKKSFIAIAVLLFVIATSYVACAEVFSSGTWRYKITINVETHEGLKSGSSVREVHAKRNIAKFVNPDVRAISYEVSGEAAVVDLGKHGKVFEVLAANPYQLVFDAFPPPSDFHGNYAEHYNSLNGQRAVLDQNHYPLLVRFADLDDPKSVMPLLDTKTQRDNFFEVFGEGVKIDSIEIQITNEPVTWGISKWLPWLDDLEEKKARLNGSTSIAIYSNELSDNLGAGSFRRRK